MDAPTDAEVIASSVTTPAAFAELFDRHATTMFRYFVRRVGPDGQQLLVAEEADRFDAGAQVVPEGFDAGRSREAPAHPDDRDRRLAH